jgi:hypothetical protein
MRIVVDLYYWFGDQSVADRNACHHLNKQLSFIASEVDEYVESG